MENKVCKNKKCLKPLPEDYKHKYCEACRNQQVQKVKNGFKAAGTVVGIKVIIVIAGKVNPKK